MVRVWFADFWKGFDPEDNFFTATMKETGISFKVTSWWPEVLVFSVFGNSNEKFKCRKLFYTGENVKPDFARCDYALSFEHLDDPRHLRMPVYIYHAWYQSRQMGLQGGVDAILQLLQDRPRRPRDIAQRDKFCGFVFGNGNVPRRNEFFHRLSRYKQVASAGSWLNNTGFTVRNEGKIEFLRSCKFNIAFENESAPGYTTEKILDPLVAGCIPIYWGNPEVVRDFNPACFVNAQTYASDEALIEHIAAIDRDDARFEAYQRVACFNDNRPTPYWDMKRIRDFMGTVFAGRKI